MASSSSSGKNGSRSPDGDRRKKLISFWKEKEKLISTADVGTSPSTPSLSSTPIPSQAKAIPNHLNSSLTEGNNNNHSRNNSKTSTAITSNNNNTMPSNNITTSIRRSQENISSNYSNTNTNNPLSRSQLNSSGPQTKNNNNNKNIKSSSEESVSPLVQETYQANITTSIFSVNGYNANGGSYSRLVTSDTQPAGLLASRRSSLSERLLLGLTNRPAKPATTSLYTSDDEHASFLIQKIQELEIRLSEVEYQLKSEILKRVEKPINKYNFIMENFILHQY